MASAKKNTERVQKETIAGGRRAWGGTEWPAQAGVHSQMSGFRVPKTLDPQAAWAEMGSPPWGLTCPLRCDAFWGQSETTVRLCKCCDWLWSTLSWSLRSLLSHKILGPHRIYPGHFLGFYWQFWCPAGLLSSEHGILPPLLLLTKLLNSFLQRMKLHLFFLHAMSPSICLGTCSKVDKHNLPTCPFLNQMISPTCVEEQALFTFKPTIMVTPTTALSTTSHPAPIWNARQ